MSSPRPRRPRPPSADAGCADPRRKERGREEKGGRGRQPALGTSPSSRFHPLRARPRRVEEGGLSERRYRPEAPVVAH